MTQEISSLALAAEKINILRKELINEYKNITEPDYIIDVIYKAKIIALEQALHELGYRSEDDALMED